MEDIRPSIGDGRPSTIGSQGVIWRSQIFEACPQRDSLCLPFAPETVLSLVHVEDVARMLFTFSDTAKMSSFVYHTPVEIWEGRNLKETIEELTGIRVELRTEAAHGGPMCDGGRFAREFGFQLRSLRDRLSSCVTSNPASPA